MTTIEKRRYRILDDGDGHKYRVLVVIHEGIEGHIVRWTTSCSGCTEYVDGQWAYGPMGCGECGYSGKRRQQAWVPIDPRDW
jgi:hypothetical protein